MKQIIALSLLALSLSSCARVYVREWTEDSVTACGNPAANVETINAKASETCGGDAKIVGGRLVATGQSYVGYGQFAETTDRCFVYRCGAKGPAPASVKAEQKPSGFLDKILQ